MTEQNWAGTYAYAAPRIERVASVDDVVRLVRAGGPVHALGTRHSFTDLPDTTGTLIDMAALSGVLEIDAGAMTARVAAGTRYGIVASALDEQGLAFRNMGSLPHINVAGAISTATHGSGDRNGVLSTSVAAFTYVGADGELHEVRRGDALFEAQVVGVGAFGVIVDVTLDVVPSFRMRQDVYGGVSWDAALTRFGELTSAGYSVSIFTRWEQDTIGWLWVKTRLESDDDEVAPTLLDGAISTEFNPLGSGDNVTPLGEPGPWMLRLPHFRLDREPSYGAEIQTEYFVPHGQGAEALDALRPLGDRIRPHLAVSEVRTAAADGLWLSPAYERDVAIIHFTWHDHPDEVAALLPEIEARLAPFDARPHWGKVHAFTQRRLEEVVPRLHDARAEFDRLDPEGRFANAHLRRLGLRS